MFALWRNREGHEMECHNMTRRKAISGHELEA